MMKEEVVAYLRYNLKILLEDWQEPQAKVASLWVKIRTRDLQWRKQLGWQLDLGAERAETFCCWLCTAKAADFDWTPA
jgi:hypothetical protein